jgi:hypothetical protein
MFPAKGGAIFVDGGTSDHAARMLLSETKQVRFLHLAPKSVRKRRHSITDECAELLWMLRVQIALPLPT